MIDSRSNTPAKSGVISGPGALPAGEIVCRSFDKYSLGNDVGVMENFECCINSLWKFCQGAVQRF